MEKRSSHGCLLEHLETYGIKIMTRGPIVRQLGTQGKYRKTKILEDEFHVFFILTTIILP